MDNVILNRDKLWNKIKRYLYYIVILLSLLLILLFYIIYLLFQLNGIKV